MGRGPAASLNRTDVADLTEREPAPSEARAGPQRSDQDMGPISRGQSGSLPVRPRAASVRPRPAAVLLGQPVLVRLGERHGVGVTVRCVPLMRVLVQVLEPRGRAELGAVVLLDLPLRAYPRDVPAVELLV